MKLALWMPVLALFFVLTFPSPTAYAEVGQNDQDKFRLSDCSGLQNLQVPGQSLPASMSRLSLKCDRGVMKEETLLASSSDEGCHRSTLITSASADT